MASLMAMLGLDASRFHSGLKRSEEDAKSSGKKIKSSLSPKVEVKGDIKSGAMREALVLMREISRGNWSRVPGSFSLLLQKAGLLKYVLNPITGIVLGLAAGFYAAYKFSGALVDKLTGLKFPEIHPEYIAKHLQKANQAAEAQKEINRQVEKTVELYDSAAKAAERNVEVIKEAFDHQRKMNEYHMQKELNDAKTDKEKQSIRKKYSDAELELKRRERQAEVDNKEEEFKALSDEASKRKSQGDSIQVNSKEHDAQIVSQRKKAAEEAQKYLDDLDASKNSTGGKAKEALIRGYNSVALSGVSGKDLDKAEADNRAEAHRRIQAARDAVDMEASNDEQRKRKNELYKQSEESATKAAELMKSLPDIAKNNTQKNKDEEEEAKAKLEAEAEKHTTKSSKAQVNSLQAIGAYAPQNIETLNVARRSEQHLKQIRDALVGHGHRPHHRGAKY